MNASLRKISALLAGNRAILWTTRFLHLNRVLKKLYALFFAPKGHVQNILFGDLEAKLYVESYEQMRYVETIFMQGLQEDAFLEILLRYLKPGDVVYDIGAHIGLYSVFLSKKVDPNGVVVSFEPDQANFIMLNRNIVLNQSRNIRTFPIALGDEVAERRLYYDQRIGSLSSSLIPTAEARQGQTIKVIPGDVLVSQERLPLPKAVKIDTEGYEYPVLVGLQKTLASAKCRILLCEIHSQLYPEGMTKEGLRYIIDKIGFSKIELIPRGSEIQLVGFKP